MKRKSLVGILLVVVLALSIVLVACGEITAPTVDTIKVEFAEGATLESVTLPEGFSWKDKSEALLEGKHAYTAVYSDGKKTVEVQVSVDMAKKFTAPTLDTIKVEWTKDATLEGVVLPAGFSWNDEKTKLALGGNSYDATYTDGEQSIAVKVVVEMIPTDTMIAEHESMIYLEKLLNSDEYKAGGAKYEDTTYDQYVMILARSARGANAKIKDAYMARLQSLVKNETYLDKATNKLTKSVPSAWGTSTLDYNVNATMTLLALGESTVVDGVDIAAPFYDETYAVASYAYALNNNLNVVKNLTIPAKYKTADGVEHDSTTTVAKVVNALLKTQKEGGGWETAHMDYSKDPAEFIGMVFDVDTTTMALMALSGVEGEGVDTAISHGVADIMANIRESGSIDYFKGDNISGTSTAITALSASGIDARNVVNSTSKKNLFDYQKSMRITTGTDNGAYASEWSKGFKDDFATKDSLIALVSYNRMLRGESSFFLVK